MPPIAGSAALTAEFRAFAKRTRFAAVGLLLAIVPANALAEALIGDIRVFETTARPIAEIAALKAQYRRPSEIPFPSENPFTPQKAALGKQLYFDPRLSVSASQSCSSCHNPSFGWGDGLSVGVGNAMERLPRRSPSIVNAAWGSVFMWDGRASSLEEQAQGPIQAAAEMNMPMPELLDRLADISEYQPLFAGAFPGQGLTARSLTHALATYERTVVSEWAPFDAWVEGDETAMPDAAKRGFAIFNGKAGCSSCHAGWNFTEDSFHDIGLPGGDVGRAKFLPTIGKMQHAFKTPGLREIASRGPYMHDGSLASLEAVIEHYDRGGIDRSSRSDLIRPLGLTLEEKSDLVAFLHSLSSSFAPTALPVLPR